jgi:hypothetical protein
MTTAATAGDLIPQGASIVELRTTQLRRLFNQMDPSPFHDRDIDPNAEEFIVGWCQELPRAAPLALVVHLDRSAGEPGEAQLLRDAMQQYFRRRSDATRLRLRQVLRIGRMSLVIGVGFLVLALGAGQMMMKLLNPGGFLKILDESLIIGGWVAMWRPIEILLYDWWPIRAERRLFDRLASMPVQIRYRPGGGDDAWRLDWPATEQHAQGPRPVCA